MEAAGLSPARQGELLKLTVEQAEAALTTAMATLNPTMPDWYARIQAAKFIRDLLGASPSKVGVSQGSAQVQVNIELPSWARPVEAKVIDSPA